MRSIVLAISLLISSSTFADWWGGVDFGAYSWNPSPNGVVGRSNINTQTELNWDNQTQPVVWAAVEMLDAWYPNLRFEHSSIEMTGSGNLASEKILRNAAFDGPVLSGISYSTYDFNLYYQLYDNFITLDLGLALRVFDGYIAIAREDQRLGERANFLSVIPLGYAAVNIDMPLKGWYSGVVFNGGGFDRTLLTDVTWRLGWKYEFELINYSHIGLEAGFRQQNIELHQIDSLDTNFDVSGGFVGLNLRFGF